MAAVLTTPEDYVNAALVELGAKRRIGSLYDGSETAKKCLDIYGQARDSKLREFEWGFAERDLSLTLLKTAPVGGYSIAQPWTSANPIPPFIYEYAYPADMLKLRALRNPNGFIPNFDPKPIVWRIANDTISGVQQKVILCNLSNALAVYTGQVTDPTLWEVGFGDALIADLVRRLAAGLSNADMEKLDAQMEGAITQEAEMRLG